jgi:hypothetical protein
MLTLFGAEDLETTLSNVSLTVTIVGAILVVILLILAAFLAKKAPKVKLPLFVAIVVVILGTTFTIGGNTIYLNLKSAAGGPVHWHADFEIWACGNELNLRDPVGLENKVGTPTLHEHNDKRIHLEGVPTSLPYDFSLGKFMDVAGGSLSSTTLTVPLNNTNYFENAAGQEDGDGYGASAPDLVEPFIKTEADGGKMASFTNGQKCGGQAAEVQVFAYRYNAANKTYQQTKITNPANYAPAQEDNVPPGDCVIMEFAPAASRTDKLCKQYGLHDTLRCQAFGVPATEHQTVCDSTDITNSTTCAAEAKNPLQGISATCAPEVTQ